MNREIRKRRPLAGLFLALLLLAGCGDVRQPAAINRMPERIISLAPNITETVYALGLDGKLVGVTAFCTYPPAAREIPRVGGFGQFNYEAIVVLNPDLVIVHKEYNSDKARLTGLGIPYLETGNYYVSDILGTIQDIGNTCGAAPQADKLIQQLKERMATLRVEPPRRPRVLMAFGGSAGQDVNQVHAFGTACLHNELLETAGGENVLTTELPYSILSREALLRLDPEIILVLAPELDSMADEQARWERIPEISAVQNRRVHMLTNDYTCIPGPRFIQILEDFVQIIETE